MQGEVTGGTWLIWLLMAVIIFLISCGMYVHMPLVTLNCVPSKPDTLSYTYEDCAIFQRLLFAIESFLERHTELLTALATGAIAYFTLTLKQATSRLWKATVGVQRVSERALTELERPWVHFAPTRTDLDKFWSRIKSQGGPLLAARAVAEGTPARLPVRIEVDFVFVNHGRAPAVMTALFCSFESRCGPPPSEEAAKQQFRGNPVIRPGADALAATVWMEDSFDAQRIADFLASKQRIWLWGRLIYQNAGGPSSATEDHETEFLWVFDGPNDTLAPSDEGGPRRNRRT